MSASRNARAEAERTIAYVIDPRFPGGTSGAVAEELRVAVTLGRVSVHALETGMFRGRYLAPPILRALDDLGLEADWDSPVIAADTVIFHNPVCLKSQSALGRQIVAGDLIVVTHSNVIGPAGGETFAVSDCLRRIAAATTALRRWIAPVSPVNRATFLDWATGRHDLRGWSVLGWDWHNICAGAALAPATNPRDRRGRHSRPGLEKFPSLAALDVCFPRHAHANVILGGDLLLGAARTRPHWDVHPFGAMPLADYFDRFDFMVYYTSPFLAESFGRSMAEAILAGKVVISDPVTASVFGGGVIPADPGDVDAIIAAHVADPLAYATQVDAAQRALARYSAEAFRDKLGRFLADPVTGAAA